MSNAMPTDCEELLSADGEGPRVPDIHGANVDRRKARFALPLLGAIAAVVSVGIWAMGSRGHHLQAMSTDALVREYAVIYGYKNVGAGACVKPNGDVIQGTKSGIKEYAAQKWCDSDPKCKGYVASSGCRGAYMYNNPDGTVKGGGEQPEDSYTWTNQPCMAKDLDMVYQKLGYGKCLNADGKEPTNELVENIYDVECRRRCSIDKNCLGFSAATMNHKGCYLWKEGPLKAGGTEQRWKSASCYEKEASGNPASENEPAPAPPAPAPAPEVAKPAATGDDVKYTKLGPNKCTNAEGTQLKHKWFGKGNEKSLQDKCNKDSACYGYSASRYGGGLLWMEAGLKKGGLPWGSCSCMVKAA